MIPQPAPPLAPTTTFIPNDTNPQGPPTTLNLVTLNCWGLLHISAQRPPRLDEIGRQISLLVPAADIVCLQECWVHSDFLAIRRRTRHVLPYAKFYHSGAFGGGLAVLSRWPIEESSMFKYPLNGRPTAFWRGDWYVGKGVACAKIRFGAGKRDVVEVFNTHTHAPYEELSPDDTYLCHRTAQAWEMSKLLRAATDRGHLVVALGDFNMVPLSLAHRLITTHAPVRDVWRILHPDSSLGPAHHPAEQARRRPIPTADFNVAENGATSDSVYNTWRWNKTQQNRLRAGKPCDVAPDTIDPRGKRLDYIFASTGLASDAPPETPGWVVKSAAVALTDPHPTLFCSLSDHFAVRATLTLHTPSPPMPPRPKTSDTALQSGAYLAPSSPTSTHSTDVAQTADPDAQLLHFKTVDESLPVSVYDEILDITENYTAREVRQRYWRGIHFFIALFIWFACLIAVWFIPSNGVAFALMLVSSLSLVAGVVDGLLSLLFFSWEIRGLKEFEWEIRNAKAVATGDWAALADAASDGKPEWSGDSQ